MKEYFNKYYVTLKNNIAMIALIPTIVGGIWQIIQLGQISFSMIRFFSVSQLITDGIIILLFLALPLMFFIAIFFSDNLFTDLYLEKNYNLKSKIRSIFQNKLELSRFALYFFTMGTILTEFREIIKLDNIVKLYYIIISLGTISILFFLILFNFLKNRGLIEVYFVICNLLLFAISIYSLQLNYKTPNNISNFNLLIDGLEKQKCYSKKPKILYFNDKYIFVELEVKSKKEIMIKKIEDLFE